MISVTPADPLVTAWLDTSDLGNAKRLVAISAGKLLWIEDVQAFGFYDGRRWSMERGAIEAQRMAHRVVEHIDAEAEALGTLADDARMLKERVGAWCTPEIAQERVKTLRGHAVRSGSANMTAGMLKQARSLMMAMFADFDTDPLAYNTLNYTLRFQQDDDGKWQVAATPHDQSDMIMQLANVDYDPEATCPFWNDRLSMLTPDAEQLAGFRTLYGYTLTGLTSDQAFYVHQGKGGDGKSVTHMALADMHGDYYRHAGVKTFLEASGQKAGSEHRSDLVRLKGDVRMVTIDEPPARSVWDGGTIKQITGSLVTARGANERTEVTFTPRFKLFAECNIIPRAPSDDKGFRRRFKLYMWSVAVEDTKAGTMPIDIVLSKLKAEKSGILNWMIAGALDWLATRVIPQPSAMTAVLSDFWADSSPLLEWMGEWCDMTDPTAQSPAKALHDHFKQWCEERGHERVMTATAFGRALRDKQFTAVKDSKGNRWRKGIRLRDTGEFGLVTPAVPPAPPLEMGNQQPSVDRWEVDDMPP
jgi:putative DNA primase/helicase